MKTTALFILMLISSATFGQQLLFTIGDDKTKVINTIPPAESINNSEFELFSHYSCSNERQEEIYNDFDGIISKLTINGHEIELLGFDEIDHLFSFQADEDETYHMLPSIQSEIPLQSILQGNGKLMNATGNKLTLEYFFKDELIASGNLTFDIPQFNEPSGDFCQLRPSYISDLPEFVTAMSDDFAVSFSHYQLLKAWLPSALSNVDGLESTSGIVLFSDNGNYGTINYEISRQNGIITVEYSLFYIVKNIHPDCVKTFLAN